MDDAGDDDGIEDDRLRLVVPVPPGYDPGPLASLAAGGRTAALLLPPSADPDLMRPFGNEHGLAIFARDDLEAARGLDGVLLTDPAEVEAARARLGPERLIGALCAIDRHLAMTAGEAGADWILFGRADHEPERAIEVAAWWSELFVLPCGVTGLIEPRHVRALHAAKIEFLLPGPAAWRTEEPLRLFADLDAAIAAAETGGATSSES